MTKILIVEGNTAEIIAYNRKAGIKLSSEYYHDALAIHAPHADFSITSPFAPELQDTELELKKFDAFALTGSGVKWTAGEPETKPYLDFLQKIMNQRKPIIGSCWGLQTVVQLMGGRSAANNKGVEIGLAENLRLTEAGRAHWVFEGMPDAFPSPCIHRDHVVDLPECFTLLASNAVSQVQAIACQSDQLDFIGFQYHPELPFEHLKSLADGQSMHFGATKTVANFPDNPPDIVNKSLTSTLGGGL